MDVLNTAAQTDIERVFDDLTRSMQQLLETERPDLSPIIRDLLKVHIDQITRPEDAAKFLHLLAFLSRGPIDESQAWRWARAVAAPHPQHPGVLSLLASLGDLLRMKENSNAASEIQFSQLEQMLRTAMEVAPDQPGAFARAGLFYLNNRSDEPAERCLLRAFELDPRNAFVAIQLSDLFNRTNRAEQGLAVLDKCIQQGEPQADVLWKAGLAATSLAKPESALWYLTQLCEIEPDRRWVHYYRAIALLELQRYADAAGAIDQEAALIRMPTALHVHTVRAAAAVGLGETQRLRQHIDAAVSPPLGIVNYLSPAGIVGCFTRLWSAAASLPERDPSRLRLEERMLSSGLTPATFWDQMRVGGEKVKGLKHFWVDLRQPLDQQWVRSGSAVPEQQYWKAYRIRYGVLASDETEAQKYAMQWQSRSAPLPAQLIETKLDGGSFTDVPGVTQRTFPGKSD
jgi:tetratricopeptide (TPR) repeat protein